VSESGSDALVSRLTQLGSELEEWSLAHRDASLAEQERAVLERVRAALPDLLGAVVTRSTSALNTPVSGLQQRCPGCGKRRRSYQWREREVLTVCGLVRFRRPYYYCRRCKRGWAPADGVLEVGSRERVSGQLEGWLARLGAATDFREAAGVLEELTGIGVAAETVRQHSEGVGAELEAAQQAAIAQVERTQEAAEPVEAAPGVLVVETDGVMVRYLDAWHEVKLGLVGGHEEGRTRALSYVAARESAEQFGPRLLAESARRGALEIVRWEGPVTGRGLAVLPKVVVLGDGAHWIWALAADYFGTCIGIVDYYHASEHVWTVANAVYGQGSPAAKAWAEDRRGELYEQGAEPVLQALGRLRPATEDAQEVVRRELGYFRSNRERMAYPEFLAQGLPIGSGAAESGAKHVVQLRMKRPGARWSDAGAQGVLTLRAHLSSGRPLPRTSTREARAA
jgi:hypothetical protein